MLWDKKVKKAQKSAKLVIMVDEGQGVDTEKGKWASRLELGLARKNQKNQKKSAKLAIMAEEGQGVGSGGRWAGRANLDLALKNRSNRPSFGLKLTGLLKRAEFHRGVQPASSWAEHMLELAEPTQPVPILGRMPGKDEPKHQQSGQWPPYFCHNP